MEIGMGIWSRMVGVIEMGASGGGSDERHVCLDIDTHWHEGVE